jgi:hypothetical protein
MVTIPRRTHRRTWGLPSTNVGMLRQSIRRGNAVRGIVVMGVLGGVWNFDQRPVDRDTLVFISRSTQTEGDKIVSICNRM